MHLIAAAAVAAIALLTACSIVFSCFANLCNKTFHIRVSQARYFSSQNGPLHCDVSKLHPEGCQSAGGNCILSLLLLGCWSQAFGQKQTQTCWLMCFKQNIVAGRSLCSIYARPIVVLSMSHLFTAISFLLQQNIKNP